MEITSIANFLSHVVRIADVLSEQQLCLLKDNISQALTDSYTKYWDPKNIELYANYRKIEINVHDNLVDIKLQKAILDSYLDLSIFASYFQKGVIILVYPGEIKVQVTGTTYQLFSYLGPPKPWKLPITRNCLYASTEIQGIMDKWYRKKNGFLMIELHYFNTLPIPNMIEEKQTQFHMLAAYVAAWH